MASLISALDEAIGRAIDEMYAERMAWEAEVMDDIYQMWESTIPCSECGSKQRHGVPSRWTACGGCDNERL